MTTKELPPNLTGRQRETLGLIAEGLTNPEIAARMGITARTVKAHSDELRRRFQVDRKNELIGEARRFGLD